MLDLILLKRNVYRHLLFNRGAGVRRVGTTDSQTTPRAHRGVGRENVDAQIPLTKDQTDLARTKVTLERAYLFNDCTLLLVFSLGTLDAYFQTRRCSDHGRRM